MGIKMVDLHSQYLRLKEEIDNAIQEVIDSSAFINGKPVELFAQELAEYIGVNKVVPCANGTDALQIAYQALGLKSGDEVLMPAFNYVASAEAAALLGLKPVFVDVHEDTFNIDENKIREKITTATKAIVVVHLFGQSANLAPILQIADEFGLKIIEDNAQSLGSTYLLPNGQKKRTGSIGHINTQSFFPTKNLGCFGDGGAISTDDELLAQKALMISRHGQGQKYAYQMIGCNSRLDTLQAAVLRVKLENLKDFLTSRSLAGNYYNKLLRGIPEIVLPANLRSSYHTYNQYVIKVPNRDMVKEKLMETSVPSMIYYPSPLHLQKAYAYLGYQEGDFPVAEKLCKEVLALPVDTEITYADQDTVVANLIKIVKEL